MGDLCSSAADLMGAHCSPPQSHVKRIAELEARQEQSDATAAEQEGRLARLLVRLEEGSSASAHLEKGMQVRRERPL